MPARIPAQMDRLDTGQRHVDGSVYGGAGRCQDPYHPERQIVMLAERGAAGAVGDDDGLIQPVAELLGHLGTEHRLEWRVERPPLPQL